MACIPAFELCESAALPGREEYYDLEKYEIRHRDWNAPGNIIAYIAQLNRLRRADPALHDFRDLLLQRLQHQSSSTPK